MSNVGVPSSTAWSPIFVIADNEVKRVVFNPLSIVVFVFLLLLVFLNVVGNSASSARDGILSIASLGYVFYSLGQYCAAVAVFIGAMSLAEERSRHSLSILLTKPLYRRDIIVGKFLGLNAFMLLFVSAVYLAYVFFLFLLVGTPASWDEFFLRFVSIVLTLFLESSLALGIAMLAGVLFKKLLHAALVAVTFFYIVWFSPLLNNLGNNLNILNPFMLSFQILMGNSNGPLELLDITIGYTTWLSAALPYLVFILLEIIVVLAVDCMKFIRSEEA